MARRKFQKENIRNLQKSHGTYYVTLPKNIISDFGWKERQKVVVKRLRRNKIIISDWEK